MRILLVDDHEMVREGFRNLLDDQPDMEVVGEASTGAEALRLLQSLDVDIVIMDVVMPDMNGIEATRTITKDYPDVKVIGLSIYSDENYIRQMFKAGAVGYVVKTAPFRECINAAHTVQSNQIYLSNELATEFFQTIGEAEQKKGSAYKQLSSREREVLQMLAEGKSTRKIAEILDIGVKTVETHRWRLMKKLEIDNVADLTKYALREGIIKL